MKILVIGLAASGKTTIKNYLRENTNQNVGEVDEEILRHNNNTWPADNGYKDNVLVPKIYEAVSKE